MPTIYPGVGYVLLQEGERIATGAQMLVGQSTAWVAAPLATAFTPYDWRSGFWPHRRPRTFLEAQRLLRGVRIMEPPDGWAYVVPGEIIPAGSRSFCTRDIPTTSLGAYLHELPETCFDGCRYTPNFQDSSVLYIAPLGAVGPGQVPFDPPAPEPPPVITSTRPPRGVRRASVVPLNLP